jgi:hypothetical protein
MQGASTFVADELSQSGESVVEQAGRTLVNQN